MARGVTLLDADEVAKSPADERLRRLIDRQTPKLQRLLLAALRGLSQGSVEALTNALEAQDLQAAITAAVGELDAIRGPLRDQLLEAITESARVSTARFGMSFDLADPNAIRVAESLAANAVVGVELETKQAIRDIIVRGFQEGIPPRAQAREIMRLVGLTGRDAQAVDNLWMRMMGDGVKADLADARAMRYADRLLRRRAEMIARTEMISASTQGRRLGWQQAADAGLVDPASARIVWIVSNDDRLCPTCAPMAGVTVGFYDPFTATERATGDIPRGSGGITPYTGSTEPLKAHVTTNGPPQHPRCRCDIGLVFAV